MFRKASLLFICIHGLCVLTSAEPPVTISQSVPSLVNSSTGFVVSLTINKGSISGFARVHQTLPDGYKAEPLDTWNARFQQVGQDVKFIWLELPSEPVFTISYRVNPEKPNTEAFSIGGTFSYMRENKTVRLPIESWNVTIGEAAPAAAQLPEDPTVTRRIIATRPEEGEYSVELTIVSGNESTNARFIDYIPAGYQTKLLESGTAIFTDADGRVDFYWENLNSNTTSKITYTVRSGRPETEAPAIQGVMLYGDEARSTGSDRISQPIAINSSKTNGSVALKDPVAATSMTSVNKSAPMVLPQTPTISAPNPGKSAVNGVYFKVQVVATRYSPVRDQSWFSTNMGNKETVDLFQYSGWNKYQVGHFYDYEEAARARSLARTFSNDAFIVAFLDGKPVTVSEAIRWQQANP